jgi:hypothetical protein
MSESRILRPSTALAAYGEPLIEGRRVLVYGEATSSLAEHLLDRGARTVHVCDRDPGRVAEASTQNTSRNVSFAPLGDGGMALREGAFDVAIVENLAAVGDVSQALSSVKRALSARGVALIACANPDVEVTLLEISKAPKISIDYYSLYDAVVEEFEYVRMLGQTPFVGYAIADFAPDADPLPALDTGCVPGGAEEPEWFVALASHRALLLDEFAIIQLPFASTWRHSTGNDDDSMLRAARSAERRTRQRVAALEAENRRLTRGEARRDDAGDGKALQKELERRNALIDELEGRCTTADARADETQRLFDEYVEAHPEAGDTREGEPSAEEREAEEQRARKIGELESQIERGARKIGELESQVERGARKVGELEQQVKDLELESKNARQRVAAAEETSEKSRAQFLEAQKKEAELRELLEPASTDPEQDVAHLEAQLAERGREIARLERDLSKTETMARNLLRELEEALTSSGEPARRDLELKLDELAQKNAAREADLVALRWTVAQLSGKPVAADNGEKSPE